MIRTSFLYNKLLTISLLLLTLSSISAGVLHNQKAAYTLDLPTGWKALSVEDPALVSFSSADGKAVIQIYVFEKDKFKTSEEIFTNVKGWLKAEGEGALFFYNEYDSHLADLTYNDGTRDVRGYFIFVNDASFDYAIMAYCPKDSYNQYQGELLSALDSFSADTPGRLVPGPVSHFLLQTEKDVITPHPIDIGGVEYIYPASKNQIESSQVVIDREAIVLSAFKNVNLEAWERYYRMIYRDNYLRLETIFKYLQDRLKKYDSKQDRIERAVKWVQGFEFTRTGTHADLLSPVGAAALKSGDCDTRVILLLILLHYMEVDARILVSHRFAHSAIGINIDEYQAKGAVLEKDGEKYLYTELTGKEAIGQIDAKMADPAGWNVFKLRFINAE